ncbi:hypothetical protein Bca4012_071515 [Brassica carinata]
MLISHGSLDVNDASKLSLAKLLPQQVVAVLLAWLTNVAGEAIHGKGARRRHIWYTTILSTIGEARARAWQVATPPVAVFCIGQGMYISVFCAREPETGRILAFKKARFDNFEADSVRSITRQIVILRRLNQVFLLNQKLMVGLSIWGIRAYIKYSSMNKGFEETHARCRCLCA